MMPPVLSIDGLCVSIAGTTVLNSVDLMVSPGEIVGLVGESGSGKSMTALASMGLLPPGARQRGSIRLVNDELIGLPERALCDLRGRAAGMVFQEPMTALNPLQTIGEQVAETVRVHTRSSRRQALEVARETLDKVGLPQAQFSLDRYPHDLSGGQRQRVVIAMAIAMKPALLIADEPTTALDVTTQARILDLLTSLVTEDGIGLLLITHDLAVVSGMAHRIAVMQAGTIVEQGAPATIFGGPAHAYTRRLLAASDYRPKAVPGTSAERSADLDPLLSVDRVTRRYRLPRQGIFAPEGSFTAVDAVSLTVAKGENVGLVGESGCGKSTLARAILGLERVQDGYVDIAGRRFADRNTLPDASQRRDVQVVFQDPYGSFNPRHRVARLVAEPLHLLGKPPGDRDGRESVSEALTAVGLKPSDAEKYPHEFSGGQRQRIAIARALIVEPKLIVLDEAVSALDVSIRAQILDLLAKLSRERALSYLFISHDINVVRAITDRVLVMHAGKIVEEGSTADVLERPSHAYTSQLVAATPRLRRDNYG